MTQLLRLAYNCLTFDFIGTSTDESSDDLCTVQIPTSWRPAFLDYTTLKLFFDLYHSMPNTLSPLVSNNSLLFYIHNNCMRTKIKHLILLLGLHCRYKVIEYSMKLDDLKIGKQLGEE